MSEFDKEKFNNEPQGEPTPGSAQEPENSGNYQQPGNQGTTYYTPPKSETQAPSSDNGENVNNNTTYHYAYRPDNQPGSSYSQNASSGSVGNNYQSENPAQPSQEATVEKPEKKKNKKTVIVVACVLVVCIIIAVVGIVLGATGAIDKKEEDTTSSSQQTEDTQTVDSGAVATEDADGNLTVAGVAKKCMDSCVGITVYANQNSYSNFYGYGSNSSSDDSSQQVSGEGSGVILSEQNGKTYIITCAHVISDGDSFKVTLNNGDVYDATYVGADSKTDIGVLSINETGLSVATFANSKQLAVGEQVVAIGCPGGLDFMNSVTSGYISALDRPVESSIGYDNECIQTDAAINPGNSGGALFNMQGQVIGINSSKIASTEYEGMGFAVPSSTAVNTANSLIKNGYVEGRAKIGITYNTITSYNNSSAILSALEEKGFKDAEGTMVVNEVTSDSDLAGKDIQKYDMIVAVNGDTLTSTDVMTQVLSDSKPGDTIELTIARIENNEIKTFKVDCKLIEDKGD